MLCRHLFCMYSSKRPDKCKRSWEKDQKSWKKVLTNGAGSGNIVEHLRDGSSESESRTERKVPSTLKIKQRKKQGTLRFASEKTQQSNSGKRKFLGKVKSRTSSEIDCSRFGGYDTNFREFDPGSGWTLAACLTHASRTEFLRNAASVKWLLNLVADGWVTREQPAFQRGITFGNRC